MKQIITVLVICLFCLQSYSQKTSDFKVGLGLPAFTGNTTGTEQHTVKAFPVLSFEKPLAIEQGRVDKFSINPGVAFFYFKENEELGNEMAGSIEDLNHISANAYIKFLYQQNIKRRSNAFIYFGGILGAHMFSKTSGERSLYSQDEQQSYDVTSISKSGKDFFNVVYYGIVAGFEPNVKITNQYKPSFELSFLPNFVSKGREKASAIQLTLLLGINQ